ncbi:MAG TPA: hypothetical protein VFP84_28415 [Kofleriaceae bacterium]|nr:hypothetical protein [Kofleriaceae bacterium]
MIAVVVSIMVSIMIAVALVLAIAIAVVAIAIVGLREARRRAGAEAGGKPEPDQPACHVSHRFSLQVTSHVCTHRCGQAMARDTRSR